jgi:hypothetical protein
LCRGAPRPPARSSRAPRAGAAPHAVAEADVAASRRTRARVPLAARTLLPVRSLDPRARATRPDRARSRRIRRAAHQAGCAERLQAHGRRGAAAWAGARPAAGSCWSRSCTARCGSSCAARSVRGRARHEAERPVARRRRPPESQASGSSARGARCGAARRARRRLARRLAATGGAARPHGPSQTSPRSSFFFQVRSPSGGKLIASGAMSCASARDPIS